MCVGIHMNHVMREVPLSQEYQEIDYSRFHARPTRLKAMTLSRTIQGVAFMMVRADPGNNVDTMRVGSDDHPHTHPDKER
jgi:hypothetical protein